MNKISIGTVVCIIIAMFYAVFAFIQASRNIEQVQHITDLHVTIDNPEQSAVFEKNLETIRLSNEAIHVSLIAISLVFFSIILLSIAGIRASSRARGQGNQQDRVAKQETIQ